MRALIIALVLLFSMPLSATEPESAPAPKPDTLPMVVLFYADWCYNCKLIVPKLAQAQKGLEDRLRFIKLDFTDDAKHQESKARTKRLGLYELYLSNKATGWAALMSADGKTKLGELRIGDTPEQMREKLEKLAS